MSQRDRLKERICDLAIPRRARSGTVTTGDKSNVERYIAREMQKIPGWFGREDAALFRLFDDVQTCTGIEGDIFEIGSYLGRSTVLLGYLKKPREQVVVCDLFGQSSTFEPDNAENDRQYPGLREREFLTNYLRFHAEPPELLIQPSDSLAPATLGRRFRLIHVDGSHLFEMVRKDIRLTRELLIPGGVVIFDDARTIVDVGAAVWEAVTGAGLTPLCYTHKLYAAWDAHGVEYVAAIERRLRKDAQLVERRIAGHRFVEVAYMETRSRRKQFFDAVVPPAVRRRLAGDKAQ